jgi:hypothetical protein
VTEVEGVQELLSTLREGDYVAIQAYVDPTPGTEVGGCQASAGAIVKDQPEPV